MAADALEPPQHVGEVAAEDAAVRVELVDDDVAEVLEEVHPLGVMRQDSRVEHVGVGEHEVGPRAHRASRVLRRVPVVGVHAHVGQRLGQLHQLGQLVLGQRLGRKQVEDARLGLLHEGLEHRQVVAERLARRGRRDHDEILALGDRLEGRAPGASRAAARRGSRSASTRRGSSDDGNGARTGGLASKWRVAVMRGPVREEVRRLSRISCSDMAHPMFSGESLVNFRPTVPPCMPCSGSCRRSAGRG